MSFIPQPAPLELPRPGVPLPHMHHAPPSMPQQPMAAARSFQILLTRLPPFLQNTRLLRDWIMSAGSARSVLLVPPPIDSEKTSVDASSQTSITALVTLAHSDAALKVLTAFRYFSMKLKDTEFAEFSAYAVPTNPDVPMPPAVLDIETVTALGDSLYKSFQRYREGGSGAADNKVVLNNNIDTESFNQDTIPEAPQGADDDDIDPLNAPAVLEAVRKFREQLSVQQGSKAVRRQQLVKEAIAKILPVIRQRVKEERERVSQAPPPALPQPSGGEFQLPPPPPHSLDAPRGVSNKPAWMTQQEQQQTDNEPRMKRLKVDLTNPDIFFPSIPKSSLIALRQFIAANIQHYLGEEEATLIDFVNQYVMSGKAVSALLPELSEVLDDDAGAFLQAVYERSQQLALSEQILEQVL